MTTKQTILTALGVALVVAGAAYVKLTRSFPRINDISTDTNDPPVFADALPLRGGARNSATHIRAGIAALQHAAYPDIAPADLAMTPAAAFTRALAAARETGWAIVSVDSSAGRIEAIATTRLLRFKDDIVIRVRPRDGGSRVDVRSASRIGRGDLGANARRIRDFIGRLHART